MLSNLKKTLTEKPDRNSGKPACFDAEWFANRRTELVEAVAVLEQANEQLIEELEDGWNALVPYTLAIRDAHIACVFTALSDIDCDAQDVVPFNP